MICVLYAMHEEVVDLSAAMVRRSTTSFAWTEIERGFLNGVELCLIRVGAGKVLSSITTQHVIDLLKPSLLILCGISGALNPDYERGDLVIGSEFMQHDLITEVLGFKPGQIPFTDLCVLSAPEQLIDLLKPFALDDARVHFGKILSGDQFVQHEVGAQLRERYHGDVVDMESAAIALVAQLNSVPLVVGRTISDKADASASSDFSAFLSQASKHVKSFVGEVVRLHSDKDLN